MTVKLSPVFNDAQLDSSGNPYTGAQLWTFAAGSTTPQTAYQDSGALAQHTNPIILNSRGEPPAPIWLTAGLTYKMYLTTPTDTTPPVTSVRVIDNVAGVNDTNSAFDQWIPSGLTPTYVGATSFTLSGDQTTAFHLERRLKTAISAGTGYHKITGTSYSGGTGLTTVTVNGTALDAGLSSVSYGVLSATNPSMPGMGTKGDLVTVNSAGLVALGVGANGTIAMARSADAKGLAYVAALNKVIFGLTYSNNVGDATNDIDFAVGGAMDSTGAYWMTLGTAITKQLDAAWAVGTNAGGRMSAAAIANTGYYVWLIGRSDTGVIDVGFDVSSTAPTMPASYDFKRLIGWINRVGGAIVAFHTYETSGGGIEMHWDVPTLDVNLANTLTTARRTDAIKVPQDFSVESHINVLVNDASTTNANWICCPDQTDAAPSVSIAPLANVLQATVAAACAAQLKIRTSATGTIAARSTLATVDLYAVVTIGFKWDRRN